MKIEVAVLSHPHEKLRVETPDLDPPKQGEVLVKMGAAGVYADEKSVAINCAPNGEPICLNDS